MDSEVWVSRDPARKRKSRRELLVYRKRAARAPRTATRPVALSVTARGRAAPLVEAAAEAPDAEAETGVEAALEALVAAFLGRQVSVKC